MRLRTAIIFFLTFLLTRTAPFLAAADPGESIPMAATQEADKAATPPTATATATAQTEEKAPAAFRLSRDVVPQLQHVRLVLDPKEPDYTGSTTIELKVTRSLQAVSFHARDLEIEAVRLEGAAGRMVPILERLDDDTMIARAPRPITTGTYQLIVDFSGKFGTRATGLYRLETGGESYAFTQFEAIDARAAFPCWDEPSFKHPWQITLVVPEGQVAVTNTPIELEATDEGWRTIIFKKTPPLPSYLLAIAVGPLEMVPIKGMSIPGNVVTVKGQSRLAGEAAASAPRLLAFLERYFDRPYPFEKLDLLALPEFWPGAMENPGAITFADQILLVDPQAASVDQKRGLSSVTAHEMAHMWFGDLVTMDWWDDLWLNEAFATWLGTKAADSVHPEYESQLRAGRRIQTAMLTDARMTSRAIRQPVLTLDNLLQSADILAFSKGHGVLRMFESWMGEETFRRGVLDYISSREWGNATAKDLWDALSRASGKDITTAMGTYLEQPGVPLVSVELMPQGKVKLTQQRFHNHGAAAQAPQTWHIPVTLKYPAAGGLEIYSLMLTGESTTITLPEEKTPDWVYPNAREAAYYRWSVPAKDLPALTAQATGRLSPEERIGLLGNLGALLDAGHLHGDVYLEALKRLGADTHPDVVAAVNTGLEKVRRTFVTPELADPFAAYVRKTLRPALDRMGMAPVSGEEESVSLLRPDLIELLGAEGKDEEVRRFAIERAASYLHDPSTVDSSLAETILSLAAIEGDKNLWELYRQRFEATSIPADRARYRAGLSAFRDPALVEATLHYSLDGPLRPQEIVRILRPVARVPEQADRVYAWVTGNYEQILERIPKEVAAFLPEFAGGCSAERLKAAEAFFAAEGHRHPGTSKEMAKVAEAVRDCVSLRGREGAAVGAWLEADALVTAEGGY